MFNFSSLAEMIGEEDKGQEKDVAEHVEDMNEKGQQAESSRAAGLAATAARPEEFPDVDAKRHEQETGLEESALTLKPNNLEAEKPGLTPAGATVSSTASDIKAQEAASSLLQAPEAGSV